VLRTIEACRRSLPKTRLWSGSVSAERTKTLASRRFCVKEDEGYFLFDHSPGKRQVAQIPSKTQAPSIRAVSPWRRGMLQYRSVVNSNSEAYRAGRSEGYSAQYLSYLREMSEAVCA
jgi:hypothetical protein